MQKLVSVAEMRDIEKAADAAGLSYAQMMENAGQSLADAVLAHSHDRKKTVLGLVGPGNNGGDTLVALALLAKQGWKASAFLVGQRPKGDRLAARAKRAGVQFAAKLAVKQDVVLDGLLGTGIRLPLREDFRQTLLEAGRQVSRREPMPLIVAVDCPSGLDAGSGDVASETLHADLTVSMAAVKLGMLKLPAFEYLGQLEIGGIGLSDLEEWDAIKRYVIDEAFVRHALPERLLDAHKGTFGTAMIVAGSQRFPGAALLAGEAAYRSGAGLVTVAAPETIQPALAGHLREATWLPLPAENGWLAEQGSEIIKAHLDRVTAILLGPGFGTEAITGKLIEKLFAADLPPLVIDADGLKLMSKISGWESLLPQDTILTPHPGEMAILSGLTTDAIQSDRLGTAEKFAKQWKCTLVLKGAFTVVASHDGRTAVMPLATPALARAGTGDVLAGLITGLRAQGMAAFEAASCAVWLHGQAGLRAAERLGGAAGVLAGDLIAELPRLIAK